MDAWSRLPERDPALRVVVAIPNPDPAVQGWCAPYRGRVELAIDPGGENARRFNARWLPRAYAVDEQGGLAYAQPPGTMDARAPREVQALRSGGM